MSETKLTLELFEIATQAFFFFKNKKTMYKKFLINSQLTENIKIQGDFSTKISPLFINFTEYCILKLPSLNSIPISLIFKQVKKNEIGYVNFSQSIKGKHSIILDKNASYVFSLGTIAHEITHIAQIKNKILEIKDNIFFWEGEQSISVNEYNIIVKYYQIDKYVNLPWEIEAYSNQKTLPQEYLNSEFFKNFSNSVEEPNLKFVISNL